MQTNLNVTGTRNLLAETKYCKGSKQPKTVRYQFRFEQYIIQYM